MGKIPKNHGTPWTGEDVKKLKELAKGNTPTPLIAYNLGRTEGAVQAKASEEKISLKPVNKSPYNRQKKRKHSRRIEGHKIRVLVGCYPFTPECPSFESANYSMSEP